VKEESNMNKAIVIGLAAALFIPLVACTHAPEPYYEAVMLEITSKEEESTIVQITTEYITTTEITTTTAAPTPRTVAEIVAFYNAAANRVKVDRPGYTQADRTHIDGNRVEVPRAFRAIAPGIIRMTQNLWGSWTYLDPVPPGACHNDFFAAGYSWSSRLQPAWVQSASLRQVGEEYHITIAMRDEHVPVLPADGATTRHGQVMKVFTTADITDGMDNLPGIAILTWDATYSGSYLQARVCSRTHNLLYVRFYVDATVDAQIRTIGITNNITLPIAQEYVFTMQVR
jgi:hypothetical protein